LQNRFLTQYGTARNEKAVNRYLHVGWLLSPC
jgi:hypothetical protein